MARKKHLAWGTQTRCSRRRTGGVRVAEDVTCGSCLRLLELGRIADFEWAARVGSEEVARTKAWADQVNANLAARRA